MLRTLLRKIARPLYISSFVALVVFLWSIQKSPTFQICRNADTYNQEDSGSDGSQNASGGPDYLDCVALTIDENHDLVIALGALFTAIFTGSLWFATNQLAKITNAQEARSRVHERAHVYGGYGWRERRQEDGHIIAKATLANYGRTPAFVNYVKVGTAELDRLPDEPVYDDKAFDISDFYSPGMTIKDVRRTKAQIVIPADGKHVAFLRVFYTDIFGDQHWSGSAYRLFIADNIVADEVVKPGSAYWATDETEPKKK